jgi:hypothetical protein
MGLFRPVAGQLFLNRPLKEFSQENLEKFLLALFHLSVCLPAMNKSAPDRRIFFIFIFIWEAPCADIFSKL